MAAIQVYASGTGVDSLVMGAAPCVAQNAIILRPRYVLLVGLPGSPKT